jgi:tRNA dimethylallyltransferase
LAEWQGEKSGGIAGQVTLFPLVLLPPRDWLYERCDRRFSTMLEQGACDEVQALLARKLDPALPVMCAIGVPEIAAYLAGESNLAEAEAQGQQATRNYAKRQYTWFRRQPPPEWSRSESEDCSVETHFVSLLRD